MLTILGHTLWRHQGAASGNKWMRKGLLMIQLLAGAVLAFAPAIAGALGGEVAAPPSCTLKLDPTHPGASISPYIYGQFIEHLGRCIRDGIWAEKLRDRKVLLEPGKSWQVIKPEGASVEVFHDPAGAYAGDHCMAVWVHDAKGGRCGLAQGNLGLEAGKEYVGYVVLAQLGAPVPVEVRLAYGRDEKVSQPLTFTDVGNTFRKFPLRFRPDATTDEAVLSITLSAPGYLWVGCVSLMPADNVQGLRADTLALVRQLKPPILRWPGGNFVSGYDWRDGIGERDRRPPRWERAWNDVEDNDFGLDEFIVFCGLIGAEPYVAVNTGLGSVENAAAEVEYANGSASTHWGMERTRNGHPLSYKVAWWGIGNEMYGDWQLGHVPVERYAARHNAFAAAMKAKDPRLKVIAVGQPGRWNDVMFEACATNMNLLSGHHYTERKIRVPFTAETAQAYTARFLEYSGSIAGGVRDLVTDFRRRQTQTHPGAAPIRLAVDEWGLVRDWNPAPDGPGIGSFEHYYTLGDAILAARGLHEILRAADVVGMANWAQTVNVLGAITTSRNDAVLGPVGHVLALYRAHLGGVLIPLTRTGEAPVDALATLDLRASRLSIGLVNYSPTEAAAVEVQVGGGRAPRSGTAARINGAELGATNVPGKPEAVTTATVPELLMFNRPMLLPPHSITVVDARWE